MGKLASGSEASIRDIQQDRTAFRSCMRRGALAALFVVACAQAGFGAEATFPDLAAAATTARQANNVEQAIALYRQALAVNSSWTEGWWFLGTLYYDSDQYPAGKDAFSHFVKLDERAAAGWALLGLCEFETGDVAAALDHVRRAMQSPSDVPALMHDVLRFHEALLLTRLGQFHEAARVYTALIARGLRDPNLITGLGLNELGRPLLPREVVSDEKELVAAAGRTAWAWSQGSPQDAEEAFQKLLTTFPDAPGVHYFYGSWLLRDHPEQAVKEFQRELQINPRNARARTMLALMMAHGGNAAAALPEAKKASEDEPSASMAQYVYGLLLTQSGDVRGIAYLQAAEKLDPADLENHTALASAYSKFGRYEDARRERQAAIDMARQADSGEQK